MISVVEPAKKRDLTTLATVKDELGIGDRASDAQLRRQITQASDAIAKYCRRVFPIETVSEVFRIGQTGTLMLSRYPVTEVVSVIVDGKPITEPSYWLDRDTGIMDRCDGQGRSVHWCGNVVVTYRAGYALPAGLPEGIERACIILVKSYSLGAERDPLIRSDAIEGAGSTEYFSGGGTGLPPEVQGLLDPHIKPNG